MPFNNSLVGLADNKQPIENKSIGPLPLSLPFAMQVADNPKVRGVIYGTKAMEASGAQPEFIAANILQANALKSPLILRSGEPPQYNKDRSPKSGVNLSKTSKQGFFKGALSKEERFARIKENGDPLAHHYKDTEYLALSSTDQRYQHTRPLDINMRDIIREVRPEGDLEVLGYDQQSGLLRLAYKEGRGPQNNLFNGQFVIDIAQGKSLPQFYSRDWDRPENDADWNPETKIINKPVELAAIPDNVYKRVFEDTFFLGYTEEKTQNPESPTIKKAEVFANRPRTAEDFKAAMGEAHPHFKLIEGCQTLPKILEALSTNLSANDANQTIIDVYNKGGSIVAGDWDGMALGHPAALNSEFSEVIDVFALNEKGLENIETLIDRTQKYLEQIKAQQEGIDSKMLLPFEQKIASIEHITDIANAFAQNRAGCITPHEFLFQQVLNDAYRDKANAHYGEEYNDSVLQKTMDRLVEVSPLYTKEELPIIAKKLFTDEAKTANYEVSNPILNKFIDHLISHLPLAYESENRNYVLPHVQHDNNVHDLYQHGFDMRNPYGSNLEGAWLLITDDGGVIYGDKQEQLIEVLLTNDFLKNNHIDVNHGANFAVGWDRVLDKQMALGQSIPEDTYKAYAKMRAENGLDTPANTPRKPVSLSASASAAVPSIEAISVKENSNKLGGLAPDVDVKAKSQQSDMKAALRNYREASKVENKEALTIEDNHETQAHMR